MEKIIIKTNRLLIRYFQFITGFTTEELNEKYSDTCRLRDGMIIQSLMFLVTFPLLILYKGFEKFWNKISINSDIMRGFRYLYIFFGFLSILIFLAPEAQSHLSIFLFTFTNLFIVYYIIGLVFAVLVIIFIGVTVYVGELIGKWWNAHRRARVLKPKRVNIIKTLYKSYRERWCKPIKFE